MRRDVNILDIGDNVYAVDKWDYTIIKVVIDEERQRKNECEWLVKLPEGGYTQYKKDEVFNTEDEATASRKSYIDMTVNEMKKRFNTPEKMMQALYSNYYPDCPVPEEFIDALKELILKHFNIKVS